MMSVEEFHHYLSMMWYGYSCADKDHVTMIIEEELLKEHKDLDHLKRNILRRCRAETGR